MPRSTLRCPVAAPATPAAQATPATPTTRTELRRRSRPATRTEPVRRARPTTRSRLATGAALLTAVLTAVAACSSDVETVSVFDAAPEDCFVVPEEVTAEVAELSRVDCAEPHHQEAYAVVDYEGEDFPGEAALKDFADGACASEFAPYVGVDYRDSTLFFTYLLPSARSWEQGGDRSVTCFVTTTGELLTASVKDSGM